MAIFRVYQRDEEAIKRELEVAARNAKAASSAPRHVKHSEVKNLPASELQRELIVEHGCGSHWFRCACGLNLSWAYKKRGCQRLLDPRSIQTAERHGIFRGTCPGCGDVHWKSGSLVAVEEWVTIAKQI